MPRTPLLTRASVRNYATAFREAAQRTSVRAFKAYWLMLIDALEILLLNNRNRVRAFTSAELHSHRFALPFETRHAASLVHTHTHPRTRQCELPEQLHESLVKDSFNWIARLQRGNTIQRTLLRFRMTLAASKRRTVRIASNDKTRFVFASAFNPLFAGAGAS